MMTSRSKTKYEVTPDKHKIHLEHPIRTLGEHEVEMRLHPDVVTKLKLRVESATPVAAPAGPEAAPEGQREAPRTEKRGRRTEAAAGKAEEKPGEKVDRGGERRPRGPRIERPARGEKPAKAEKTS